MLKVANDASDEPRLSPQVEVLVIHPSHAVDVSNGELKDGNVSMEGNALSGENQLLNTRKVWPQWRKLYPPPRPSA